MTWRNGRELKSLTTGGKTTSYEYDVNGLRNLKLNADGSYSVYYWVGDLLLAEQRVPAPGSTAPTRTLLFNYDENNSPAAYPFKDSTGRRSRYGMLALIRGVCTMIFGGNKAL